MPTVVAIQVDVYATLDWDNADNVLANVTAVLIKLGVEILTASVVNSGNYETNRLLFELGGVVAGSFGRLLLDVSDVEDVFDVRVVDIRSLGG